jgi:predicted RNase H-like nuclease (RuvC/YqgF family)
VRTAPARKLAAAGTAGTGAAIAAVAFLEVGGLPGVLYAAGLVLVALIGAVAIVTGGKAEETPEPEVVSTSKPPLWRRKSRIIAGLEHELAATRVELDEHRHALANLAKQLSRESEAAQRNAERLEQRIRELETERDGLLELVATERERFERTLDDLGGGLGRHGNELAELERELEALISR